MRAIIMDFEQKMNYALHFLYRKYPKEFEFIPFDLNIIRIIDVTALYNIYLIKKNYPKDRLKKLIFMLFDIKIQIYFLIYVDEMAYSRILEDNHLKVADLVKHPHANLSYLSTNQSIILKSRILFERIMNFIYYLETGHDLEDKSKKSKKTVFLSWLKSGQKWTGFQRYEQTFTDFDDSFRTPEVHKSSTLRKWFLENKKPNNKRIFDLLNILLNEFWYNLLAAVTGNELKFTLNLSKLREL